MLIYKENSPLQF